MLLRNIIENYVLLYYIFISKENIAKRYFLWETIGENKTNEFANKQTIKMIEEVKEDFEKTVTENLKNNGLTEEKVKRIIQKAYKNSYGWCYEIVPYGERLNFSTICKYLELEEIYKDFDYLSSTVHSNQMGQKMFNNVYFYDHVIMYIQIYLDYVQLYLEIYLEMYSLDEEKFNDIEEKIYDIQNMLSDSIK